MMEKEKWLDISSEQWREYIYSNGDIVRITEPFQLHVSNSSLGGHAHRIETCSGLGYYVAPGWKAIRWATREGYPIFRF